MATARSAKKILNSLLNLQGVNAVTVVGRDGFVIESETSGDTDLDALGAIVSTGYGASEVMALEMELGSLNQTMIECESGKILMADCGDAVLAVITDGEAIIGNIRHNIAKVIDELAEAI